VVCRFVTVHCKETSEPIEIPFGLRTRLSTENYVLDGFQIPPMGRSTFEGKGLPIVKYWDTTVSCAKTAEPIEMSFGTWTQVDPRQHVSILIGWGSHWRNLANTIDNRTVHVTCGGGAAFLSDYFDHLLDVLPIVCSYSLSCTAPVIVVIGQTIICLPCGFFFLLFFFA